MYVGMDINKNIYGIFLNTKRIYIILFASSNLFSIRKNYEKLNRKWRKQDWLKFNYLFETVQKEIKKNTVSFFFASMVAIQLNHLFNIQGKTNAVKIHCGK